MFFDQIEEYMLGKYQWVKAKRQWDSCIVQIREIHEDAVITIDGQVILLEDVLGIPLTAEWMEAAGFHLQPDGHFRKSNFPFLLTYDKQMIVQVQGTAIASFRFVHELQHFYAAVKQRLLIIHHPPVG